MASHIVKTRFIEETQCLSMQAQYPPSHRNYTKTEVSDEELPGQKDNPRKVQKSLSEIIDKEMNAKASFTGWLQ